jgi:propanol-preferring alcohol dehydrogenase
MALAAQISRSLGHVTVVGIGGGTFGFSFFALPYEASLATTYWGTLPELTEVLDLARRGLVSAHVHRFGLDEAADAYDALDAGELEGRTVVVP